HGEGALPHERDVLVGHDVAAAATTLGCRLDGAAPDSNNPRIVIPHAPGSTEFAAVLARLRASAVPIRSGAEPARMPRDAVFEVELSGGLEADALPVACFADGRIVRRAHPSAVGLRRLPSSAADTPVPARVMVRGDRVLVDPVVSSAEAQAWQLPATDGLRAAPGEGVDFELCVALGGPTSLPGAASSRVAPTGRLPLRVSGASGASITGLGPRLLGAMTLYL